MAEIKDLAGVETLVKDSVETCFMDYMQIVLGQAKKMKDLQNHCAVMDEDEMRAYIDSIGRRELYTEKEDAKKFHHNGTTWNGYPRYLKAIRVSLITLGYDQDWVETDFRDALEAKYLDD